MLTLSHTAFPINFVAREGGKGNFDDSILVIIQFLILYLLDHNRLGAVSAPHPRATILIGKAMSYVVKGQPNKSFQF